jgi:hypothetical protein
MPKRDRSGKVPAPGEAVNDGRKTALPAGDRPMPSAATPDLAGLDAAARQGWQEN